MFGGADDRNNIGDSRSRSRSPRRKHKKHRYRRSRSRTPKIFVNPTFGMQQPGIPAQQNSYQNMGYSASQLLQTNNFLESEVSRLKQELVNEQGRLQMTLQQSSMWSSEVRNLTNQNSNFERRCNELINERRKFLETIREQNEKCSILESTISALQQDIKNVNSILEENNEVSKTYECQLDVMKQQIEALNQRNADLKQKCESLVSHNRQQQEEIDKEKAFVDQSRLKVQQMEADVQCANVEIQRLIKELEGTSEKELMWQKEKKNMESIIAKREDDIRLANFRATQMASSSETKIKQLEAKLKNEKPSFQAELAMEAVYQVLETIKKSYDTQLCKLENEIEELRERQEREEVIEELPEYLKTPMKPTRFLKAPICINEVPDRPTRPLSGPSVDSPIQWHKLRNSIAPNFDIPSGFTIFPGIGNNKDLIAAIKTPANGLESVAPCSSAQNTLSSISCGSETSDTDIPIKRVKTEETDYKNSSTIYVKKEISEISEDDLLADAGDRLSPIQDIETIEKQIFGE